MEDRMYDFWAASLQNGYLGRLIGIVEAAGGAKKLFEMNDSEIKEKLGITPKVSEYIISRKISEEKLHRDYELMLEEGIKYVDHKDANYPQRLKNIESMPYGLFVKGSLPEERKKAVAIVGARQCSEYGRLMAEYYGSRLSQEGINIISGMAWGIDGIAQMSAVAAGGKSYAVLGCGADVIYPRKNYRLYERLCESGNGVISEYAPGTKAISRLFPPRNRIISGLCDALLVVEAREKSGTLITVDMAIEQGKQIMVVPGRITDPLSVGCLNLIREGATPAISAASVIDEIVDKKTSKKYEAIEVADKSHDFTGIEEKVYEKIGFIPKAAQDIAKEINEDIERVLVAITKLEVQGCIKEEGAFMFVRDCENYLTAGK